MGRIVFETTTVYQQLKKLAALHCTRKFTAVSTTAATRLCASRIQSSSQIHISGRPNVLFPSSIPSYLTLEGACLPFPLLYPSTHYYVYFIYPPIFISFHPFQYI